VHFYGNSSPPLRKKSWRKAMGKMPLALASAACKNILEISSIKQNTPELFAEENWTDWK
jgi:hypothetical protein